MRHHIAALALTFVACGGQTSDDVDETQSTGGGGLREGDGGRGAGGLATGGLAAGAGGAGGGRPEISDALSDCIFVEDAPLASCDTICAERGQACEAACFDSFLGSAEAAYYESLELCQANDVYGHAVANTCDQAFSANILGSVAPYLRCCCG